MDFWRTKKFKEVEAEWARKLKEVGFNDIETGSCLKQRASNSYRQADRLTRESKLEYYLMISQQIENDKFFSHLDLFNMLDQIVMILHAEGRTIQEISRYLQTIGLERDRKTVRYIIRRWQMKWGIKCWSLKEMNLKK